MATTAIFTTTNFGSPIQGRAAWTGTSGGFITTTANLPVSAVNQLVQLRFRMGSDNSTAGTGWRIDSFQVSLGTFQPTAGGVSISGRVFIESGRGLQNAFVTLTDTTGQTRTCRTNGFGYYHFEDIQAGQTVVLNVESKKYQFASQAVSLTDSLTEFNFMALIPK